METVCIDVSSAVDQFWSARPEALFPQATLVAITDLSNAYFERGRWAGYGPKFIKLGRAVRYRKADVVAWLEQHPGRSSTSEVQAMSPALRGVRPSAVRAEG
jgi:predicted DNA-binding transcriptional regulator AlpA